jgi:NAD(P)-dependent dehydrogenase (short-subunit alcohol dehydrogenase family)
MSDDLLATESELKQSGADVRCLAFDISEIERHSDRVSAAYDLFGGVDCLVNNAGISVHKRADLLDMSPESFDDQIKVNLRGTFFLTQHFARRMIDTASPHFRSITVISSSNAVAAAVERGEYCMAKTGLSMLVKLFALRLSDAGINVYEVRPGLIRTAMTAPVADKYDDLLAKGFSPINRWGEPDDIGRAVAMLARGDMNFATGEALHIDGGLLISRY